MVSKLVTVQVANSQFTRVGNFNSIVTKELGDVMYYAISRVRKNIRKLIDHFINNAIQRAAS